MPRIISKGIYIGIDPGASGGIACISLDGVEVINMPSSYREILEYLDPCMNAFCVIEKVGGFIGGEGHPGSAMFTFGKGYGALLMALTATSIPFEEITPQKWQRGLGIPPKKQGEVKADWKRRLKAHAEKLFPRVKRITAKTADALLIAEFCRRYREGLLT